MNPRTQQQDASASTDPSKKRLARFLEPIRKRLGKGTKATSQKKPKKSSPKRKKKAETVAGNSTILQDKSATLGKILVWSVAAFVVVVSILSAVRLANPPKPVAQQITETGTKPEIQHAGDYARGYVAAWLRATESDSSELQQYVPVKRGEITDTVPTEFRDIGIASVESSADENISTVVVSSKVKLAAQTEPEEGEQPPAEGEEPQERWVPAWYQVNVYHHPDGDFSPLGWPAPIPPAPSSPELTRAEYDNAVSDEVTQTVEEFFNAYIVGDGDVKRLTHPDAEIRALGESPYEYVQVNKITADKDYARDVPEDGTQIRIVTTVSLGASAEVARAASYALTLETRGGRWEVRAVDDAPSFDEKDLVRNGEETSEPSSNPSTTQVTP